MSPVRVVLADDHHVVRHGLRTLLEAAGDFVIVGEAADGLEVMPLVERLAPQVLILDLMMPGLNGLEVTRQVHRQLPQVKILVLSMHTSEPHVLEALRNGAAGYAIKDATPTELLHAVREVAAGRRYLSGPLSERAIAAYAEKAQASVLDPYDTLTSREREVLQLSSEGHTLPEIAARLGISPRTVETHRTNLMHKLALRTQADLIRYAVRRGLLPES
jgi:two-component system, NarL family, response regulator NreC